MNKISAIIITENEEEMIKDCIESVSFCDEIIVVDNASHDKTREIAEKLGAKVYVNKLVDFSDQRNFALAKATEEWVFYIDADERTTEEFKNEVRQTINNYKEDSKIGGYFVKRKIFYFGRQWGCFDKAQRLFYRKKLIGWYGELHETPKIEGKFSELNYYILHYTHRDLSHMLSKTNKWSEYEADLRFKANHPKMNVLRFIRVMFTGFLRSYIFEKGYKNGTEGMVESLYQAFSMFVTYAKLWEKQVKNK